MKIVENVFRFKLDKLECMVIKDGTLLGPSKKPDKDGNKEKIHLEPIMDVLCLLVKTEEHTVMIDTGFGEQPILGGIHQTGVGKMGQILKDEGIKSSEIDTVILSHIHPDHIGGLTDKKGRPAFSKARHIMLRKEWDFWMNNPDLTNVDESIKNATLAAIKRNILPIQERFSLIDGEIEIVPRIKLIKSPGHTPGHINLLIYSGNDQLMCIFDLMHSPLEFNQHDLFKKFRYVT
jgi:glyoxylase-like metal-dependent hydrolase (beta-lactamase superfamily II)